MTVVEYLAPPLEANPEGILKQFNEYMELAIPGWLPAQGNLDERLAAAASYIIAQLYEAASDGATNVYRYFGANLAKVAPKEAVSATVNVEIKAVDTIGHTIEAGTIAIWLDAQGNRQAFETINEAVIPAASSAVTLVPMRAVLPGEEGNSLSGKALELSAAISWLSEIVMEGTSGGGTDAEEDLAYLNRLTEALKLFTPKPITKADFATWALQRAGVGRSVAIAGYNSAGVLKSASTKYKLVNTSKEITVGSGTNPKGIIVGTAVSGTGIPASTYVVEVKSSTILVLNNAATETKENELTFTGVTEQAGYVSTWVAKTNGKELTGGERSEIEKALEAELLVGVVAPILNPVYVKVKVKATVFAWPNQSAAAIKTAVEERIKEYINPERWGIPPSSRVTTWENDPRVRVVNIEGQILNVNGTHYVSVLEIGAPAPSGSGAYQATDIVLTGGPVVLPELESQTVTVELG